MIQTLTECRVKAVALACLLLALAPPAALAQTLVVVERTNVQTTPGLFTPAITVLQGAAPQVVRLGERGLSRQIFWNDDALGAWAGSTFGGRGVVYVEPDIPEPNED